MKDILNDLLEGAEIDVNNNILYKITKPCQNRVVKDVLDSCSTFVNLINQTFNSTEKVNVKFSNGTINGGGNASTSPVIYGSLENYTISIRFDDSYLNNATDLSIVAITLHELVHAYLMSLYYENKLVATNPQYNTLQNAFIAFYNNSVPDTFNPLDNELHNAMKDFISKMANSIYNYANSKNIPNVTPEYCEKLAWGTMYGTELFENILTQQQQDDYANTAAKEQDGLQGAKGTVCP